LWLSLLSSILSIAVNNYCDYRFYLLFCLLLLSSESESESELELEFISILIFSTIYILIINLLYSILYKFFITLLLLLSLSPYYHHRKKKKSFFSSNLEANFLNSINYLIHLYFHCLFSILTISICNYNKTNSCLCLCLKTYLSV
jgi:hypothetical protein